MASVRKIRPRLGTERLIASITCTVVRSGALRCCLGDIQIIAVKNKLAVIWCGTGCLRYNTIAALLARVSNYIRCLCDMLAPEAQKAELCEKVVPQV